LQQLHPPDFLRRVSLPSIHAVPLDRVRLHQTLGLLRLSVAIRLQVAAPLPAERLRSSLRRPN
jgi:hypothetical protein